MQEWTKVHLINVITHSIIFFFQRLLKNIEHYQANYIITFMLLMVYCILTSPLLLIALAVSATGLFFVK